MLWYDQSLLRKFGGNHESTKRWLSRVVEFAKPRLAEPSLQIRVDLSVEGARFISRTLKADNANIQSLASLNPGKLNSYFCADIGGGILGIAYLETASQIQSI